MLFLTDKRILIKAENREFTSELMHTNTLFLHSMYNLYAFYTLNRYSQHVGSIHPAYSIYRCNTSDI